MITPDEIISAIRIAAVNAGSQNALAKKAGIAPGRISDYLHGRRDVMNMTLGMFFRLCSSAKISFSGNEPNPIDFERIKLDFERKALEKDKKMIELERRIFELEKELERKNETISRSGSPRSSGVLSSTR